MNEIIRLKVIAAYQAHDRYYPVGHEMDVPLEEAEYLMRDAPGCFKKIHLDRGAPPKEVIVPPEGSTVDRMLRKVKIK